MKKQKKNRTRRKERQEDAIDRTEHYNSLSAQEKIENLDLKLGKGIGAKKQRAKLALESSKPKSKPIKEKTNVKK